VENEIQGRKLPGKNWIVILLWPARDD
jgi:hypothetical protein